MALRRRERVSVLPRKAEMSNMPGPFAFAHESQTAGIHHIAQLVALLLHPRFHHRSPGSPARSRRCLPSTCQQLAHHLSRVFLPTLLHRLLVVLHRRNEEERAQRPQLLDEVDAVFHHGHHLATRSMGSSTPLPATMGAKSWAISSSLFLRIYSWLNQMPFS